MSENVLIEESVYKIPLILSKSLESQRNTFEQIILDAQKRLRTFAIQNGWSSFVKESFADRAEIYDNKNKFDIRFLKLHNEDLSIKLPKTVSAALEKRVFISVSPELYAQNYPEGIEEKFFEKLITHEMAHRLHIRILNNNENAMGPIWFFEGFALYAAGQFENDNLKMNHIEILKIITSSERGSYKKYAAIFRYFLRKVTLKELIIHSKNENFVEWLENIITE
ncbi:MAG: hypothetical protein K8S23_12075 [Candidatus Cloacimonetes bacterium]|nr:hypothetical protein [Candidatus Cloacimonadota bacterium]